MYTQIRRYDAQRTLGLPADGKFVAISNSDASKLVCDRKFMFAQVDHLGGRSSRAMDLGTAWDGMMQDVFSWWQLHDTCYPSSGADCCPFCGGRGTLDEAGAVFGTICGACGGLGDSALHRAMEVFQAQVDGTDDEAPTMSAEDYQETEETLRRMLEGYLHKWQHGPMDTIKIIGTQVALARPILHPTTGKPYRPVTWLERRTDVPDAPWRLAGVGARMREAEGMVQLRRVSWPWLQVGLLDVLGADRQTSMAWVIDCKASSQPSRYEQGMGVDPQLPGYCWLLEPHLPTFGLAGVAGFMYDVANSKHQPDPKRLQWKPPAVADMKADAQARGLDGKGCKKSEDWMALLGIVPGPGEFSRAQNAAVPSWRYEWALEQANVAPEPYAEHIQWLADNVDRGLYARPWQRYGRDHWERYGREIFAKAAKMSLLRKGGVGITDPAQLDVVYPRTPVCTAPGGSCPYAGPCAQDGDEARRDYTISPTQQWSDAAPPAPGSQVADSHETTDLDW